MLKNEYESSITWYDREYQDILDSVNKPHTNSVSGVTTYPASENMPFFIENERMQRFGKD